MSRLACSSWIALAILRAHSAHLRQYWGFFASSTMTDAQSFYEQSLASGPLSSLLLPLRPTAQATPCRAPLDRFRAATSIRGSHEAVTCASAIFWTIGRPAEGAALLLRPPAKWAAVGRSGRAHHRACATV